jgi:hypothetical protein
MREKASEPVIAEPLVTINRKGLASVLKHLPNP